MDDPRIQWDRRPVAAFALGSSIIVALCDDGSMWVAHPNGEAERVWVEGAPIPGTLSAAERKAEAPAT